MVDSKKLISLVEKRVILKERSSRQTDTAIKLKNNWLSRDSFRNFCIMKRVLHSGIQGIDIYALV